LVSEILKRCPNYKLNYKLKEDEREPWMEKLWGELALWWEQERGLWWVFESDKLCGIQ
jgi:hypothetical protein